MGLEDRVADLERRLRNARWRTIATVVATAVAMALACRTTAHEDKLTVEELHVAELVVERNAVIGERDKAHVAIDPNGVEIANPQQRTLIRPAETTIGDGHVKLDLLTIHDDAVVELATDDKKLRLAASTAPVQPPTPQVPIPQPPPPPPLEAPEPSAPKKIPF